MTMGRYKIGEIYGEYSDLPGCTQAVVSHSVFTPLRNTGSAKDAMQKRLKMFYEDLGYNYCICTVDAKNVVERKILSDTGWQRLDIFRSTKTGNNVELWVHKRVRVALDPMPENEFSRYDEWEKSLERKDHAV